MDSYEQMFCNWVDSNSKKVHYIYENLAPLDREYFIIHMNRLWDAWSLTLEAEDYLAHEELELLAMMEKFGL